jgi:carboxymethylenebutenolidase
MTNRNLHRMLLLGLVGVVPMTAPAQDWAREQLQASSRHQEWMAIPQGDRTVHAFAVYPEVEGKATTVLVIHENQGLTDWVRLVADRLAGAGFLAVAPDLLSGAAPGGGKTSDFPDADAAREAMYRLAPEQVMADLDAVAAAVAKDPAASGVLTVAGFCWGGSTTFQYATHNPNLKAAFPFYGRAPTDAEALARIACPVYGFYGGNDARVNASIPDTATAMQEAGKTYQPVTYDGAGHGFMRSGEQPDADPANRAARDQAWERLVGLLNGL